MSFDGTSLHAIDEAGQVIYKEQIIDMNTPSKIIVAREFERLVCADDNHNDDANNEGRGVNRAPNFKAHLKKTHQVH